MPLLALVLLIPAATIVEGFATKDKLWLRDSDGVVKVYNRTSGKSEVAAEHVVDMDRTPQGALMVVRITDTAAKQTTLELRDVAALATITSKLVLDDDAPVALIADSDPMTLVTAKTIVTIKRDGGESLQLTKPLPAGSSSAITTADGVLIGFAKGGLYAVKRDTGLVSEVKLDGQSFDTISSVITDSTKPGCAVVATQSTIARVCSAQAERLLPKGVSSLVAATKGWTAVGGGKLMRSKDGKVKESAQPKLGAWHGIDASFSKDAIVVGTTTTPLLIPTAH